MEGIVRWGEAIKGLVSKNKVLSTKKATTNRRKQICAEQLSKRIQKDLGVEVDSNDAADYTKYL